MSFDIEEFLSAIGVSIEGVSRTGESEEALDFALSF